MSKLPREFWITDTTRMECTDNPPEFPEDCIHVIEYSAYEELKEMLPRMVHSVPFANKLEMDLLKKERDRYKAALEACCAPEPDGVGGFVSDEFMNKEVLDGRKLLQELANSHQRTDK